MLRLLSLVTLTALLTTACGDDDDAPVGMGDELVGTWNLASVDVDLVGRPTDPLIPIEATITSELLSSDATVTFAGDGTHAWDGGYTASVTIAVPFGGDEVREFTTDLTGSGGQWSLTGTTLTLSDFTLDAALSSILDTIPTSTRGTLTELVAGERAVLSTSIDTVVDGSFVDYPGDVVIRGTQIAVLTQ